MSIPTLKELLAFLEQQTSPLLRRDIAKAFHIKGSDRVILRDLLETLTTQGKIFKQGKVYAAKANAKKRSVVVRVTRIEGGEVFGIPVKPRRHERGLEIHLQDPKGELVPEDVALVSVEQMPYGLRGELVRVLTPSTAQTILAQFEQIGAGGVLHAVSRQHRHEYYVAPDHIMNAKNGDLVEAQVTEEGRQRYVGRIVKVYGSLLDKTISPSQIAIHQYNLPFEFSQKALEIAEKANPPILGKREDLRQISLVTIDDEDARDFDDAVYATADTSPENQGGWRLIVAIADVASYVTPGSALDEEAYLRGNSVYLPDRVLPMLPEALSNGLCSLRPDEDRACLAVHMTITKMGKLVRHHFVRGLMKSAARLTYKKVQAAMDGTPGVFEEPFINDVLKPLYGAYKSLLKWREYRGTLELDLPEKKIIMDADNNVSGVITRERLDSHKLIEEFMVLANVAAASTLDDAKILCMFRVHDQPTPEKVLSLQDFLKPMGINFAKGQAMTPKLFNGILSKVKGSVHEYAINELVLRSQAQAVYSPENIGHFGLGLARYAHFTSPIRRYADLLVHRALLVAMKIESQDRFPYALEHFQEIATHISQTERVAAKAERETVERFISTYLAEDLGKPFEGRITGVSEFGMFVTLKESSATGVLFFRDLPHDYYALDMKKQAVVGRRTGKTFTLGENIKVRLAEVDPLKGSLSFMLDGPSRGNKEPRTQQKSSKKSKEYGPKKMGRKKHKDRKLS